MQTANVWLGIGGGRDHTVPKEGVTPSEIAVLRAIHGEDAVFDVEPLDAVALNEAGQPRTSRQEIERLVLTYGSARDGSDRSVVGQLFPGIGARAFETLDELGLPEEFFKPETRAKLKATPAPKKSGKKAAAPEAVETPAEEEDGIADMPEEENLFG
jgi:hypothetical protein